MNEFFIPTQLYSGEDALQYFARYKGKKIWVVCDAFLASGPAIEHLKEYLDGNEVYTFTDIKPDPDIETVVKGVKEVQDINPDIVVGFGGGSAIDGAKAMVYFAKKNGIDIIECIAIPTTSGTGSEVTNATVITDKQKGIKYPIFEPSIYPDVALLDPSFVVTVPKKTTANTGMDVLTHALEAYVSINANDFTDALAEKSTQLVFRYLPMAVDDGTCVIAREKMHNASTLAGMAFSQAGLGLNHAIAHQLGGQFHIPHGLANSILLAHVVRFNASNDIRARKRYARMAKLCRFCSAEASDDAAVNQLINHIKALQKAIQIEINLRSLSINRMDVIDKYRTIIDAAHNDATIATNPVKPTDRQIQHLVEAIL